MVRTFLGGATVALLSLGLVFALWLSPPDAYQGEYVRILYVHAPSAVAAYTAAAVTCVFGALYLRRRQLKYDHVAQAGAELVVLFSGLTLVSGMVWGKPVWGVWWAWDARLVTTGLLFLLYLGCVLVRGLSDDPERGRSLAAVVGIVGFLDVPIVHYSVVWFRTLHQPPSIGPGKLAMAPEMLFPLVLNTLAYLALVLYLLVERARLARLEATR